MNTNNKGEINMSHYVEGAQMNMSGRQNGTTRFAVFEGQVFQHRQEVATERADDVLRPLNGFSKDGRYRKGMNEEGIINGTTGIWLRLGGRR